MFVTSIKADNTNESNLIIIILHFPLTQNGPSFSEDDSLFEEEEEDVKSPLLKVFLIYTQPDASLLLPVHIV